MNAPLHRTRSAAGLLALVLVATACAGDDEAREQAADPPAAQPVPGGNAAGVDARVGEVRLLDVSFDEPPDRSYDVGDVVRMRFVLANEAERPDTLLEVTTPVASRAYLARDRDCDGQAERVEEIPLPAEEPVRTPAPGVPDGPERHSAADVVLDQRLLAGETAPVTFRFRNAGSGTVQVPVELTGQRNVADPQCEPGR